MIDPNVINNINVSIQAVGKKKVEALEEMKSYRKGIHSLEWCVELSIIFNLLGKQKYLTLKQRTW